jgi:hypothetical protein
MFRECVQGSRVHPLLPKQSLIAASGRFSREFFETEVTSVDSYLLSRRGYDLGEDRI